MFRFIAIFSLLTVCLAGCDIVLIEGSNDGGQHNGGNNNNGKLPPNPVRGGQSKSGFVGGGKKISSKVPFPTFSSPPRGKKKKPNQGKARFRQRIKQGYKLQSSVEKIPGAKIGLPNLGNTCFANASLTAAFASSHLEKLVENPPMQGVNESVFEFNARQKFHEKLKSFFDNRQSEKADGDVRADISAAYTALEEFLKESTGSNEIGGVGGACLCRQQGDAADMLEALYNGLGMQSQRQLQFEYSTFDGDIFPPSIKKDSSLNNLIGLTIPDPERETSFQDIYDVSKLGARMDGANQLEAPDGKKYEGFRHYAISSEFETNTYNFAIRRFIYALDGKPQQKLSTPIDLAHDLEIELTDPNDVSKKTTVNARLKSIVIHHGGVGGGHYISYVRNFEENFWIKYDDTTVSRVSDEHVYNDALNNGYVFSYEKIDEHKI